MTSPVTCPTCFAHGIGDPASCDHGLSAVLDILALRPEGRLSAGLPGVGPTDIARLSNVALSAVNQVVLPGAVEAGLIRRTTHGPEGRVVRYEITEAGRVLAG